MVVCFEIQEYLEVGGLSLKWVLFGRVLVGDDLEGEGLFFLDLDPVDHPEAALTHW